MTTNKEKVLLISWTPAHVNASQSVAKQLSASFTPIHLAMAVSLPLHIARIRHVQLLFIEAWILLLSAIRGLSRAIFSRSSDLYWRQHLMMCIITRVSSQAQHHVSKLPDNELKIGRLTSVFQAFVELELLDRLLILEEISLIILPEDNFLYTVSNVKLQGVKHFVPVACYNYSIGVFEELVEAFVQTSFTRMQKIFQSLFVGTWERYGIKDGIRMGNLPLSSVLLTESRGMPLYEPWSGYSGYLDHYFLDCDLEYSTAIKAGVPKNKITRVTSAESFQAQVQKENLERKSPNNKKAKKIILISLPPDHFDVSTCYQNYSEFLDALKAEVTSLENQFDFLLTLHPRLCKDLLLQIRQLKIGIMCTLVDGFSTADAFVCFHSATIRIAEQLRIPTFNINVFNLNYPITFSKNSFRYALFFENLNEFCEKLNEPKALENLMIADIEIEKFPTLDQVLPQTEMFLN